jgi:hypothetical protein
VLIRYVNSGRKGYGKVLGGFNYTVRKVDYIDSLTLVMGSVEQFLVILSSESLLEPHNLINIY